LIGASTAGKDGQDGGGVDGKIFDFVLAMDKMDENGGEQNSKEEPAAEAHCRGDEEENGGDDFRDGKNLQDGDGETWRVPVGEVEEQEHSADGAGERDGPLENAKRGGMGHGCIFLHAWRCLARRLEGSVTEHKQMLANVRRTDVIVYFLRLGSSLGLT